MRKRFPRVSTAVEALHHRAHVTPDDVVYVVSGQTVTYGELRARALGTASALAGRGVCRGDRCALVLPTGLDFLRMLYAVQILGATPVALNPSLSPPALARRIESLRCRLVVVTGAGRDIPTSVAVAGAETVPAVPAAGDFVPPSVTPDDLAYIQVTSGTSGEPRGVMITHRSLTASQRSAMQFLEITEADVLVNWLPLHHDFGLVRFVFGPLYFGRPCHLIPSSLLNLEEWLRTVSRVRATITASPDFAYRIAARMVDPADIDLSSLRAAINGGEPVRLSTIEAFEERFGISGVIRPGYGLAEATLAVTFTPRGERLRCDAAGHISCGRAVPGIEVQILDDAGGRLAPGERGEIVVRGEAVCSGYFDDPAGTARALEGGWLHTEDEGALDADGHLYVFGRGRNMIKAAGATIAPREAEEAADATPAVRFSAAVGVADPRTGTDTVALVAEVRPAGTATPADQADVAREISRRVHDAIGQRPGRVLLVRPRSIPTTANGKIRHVELRSQLESGALDRELVLYELRG